VGAVRSALEGTLGRTATDAEMAEKLEITVEAYRTAMAATQATHTDSIDDVYSDHSDWFVDDTPDAHDQLQAKSMQAAIAAAVATLPQVASSLRPRTDPPTRCVPSASPHASGTRRAVQRAAVTALARHATPAPAASLQMPLLNFKFNRLRHFYYALM
jgi:hypothetical protein